MGEWYGGAGRLDSNQAPGDVGPFTLSGGLYQLETKSTGAGTIDLQKLGPDGTTYTARITQITATGGYVQVTLPPGTYKWVISGFTANYLSIARIPSATG